jgi:MATE family multidrug resistance protein
MPVGGWLAFDRHWGARGMWVGLVVGLSVAALLLFTRLARTLHRRRWLRDVPVAGD